MSNPTMKFISFVIIALFIGSCKPKNFSKNKLGHLETKVVNGGLIWSLDWSPDGKFIACGNL